MAFPDALQTIGEYAGESKHGEAAAAAGDEEARNCVQQQVEYYFSAQNLATDEYLKSISGPDRFVSLFKISQFKRIKSAGVTPKLLLR